MQKWYVYVQKKKIQKNHKGTSFKKSEDVVILLLYFLCIPLVWLFLNPKKLIPLSSNYIDCTFLVLLLILPKCQSMLLLHFLCK